MENIINEIKNHTKDLRQQIENNKKEKDTLLAETKLQQEQINQLTKEQAEILDIVLESYMAINDEYTLKAIRSLGTLLDKYDKHP